MEFTKDVLNIDPEKIASQIESFIRDQLKNFFRRKGIVIGLSGGIDSAVAASLAVRAIGEKRVYGMLLPEKESNPISREYGQMMAEHLGIDCHEVEITPMLESFDVYETRDAIVKKIFPDLDPPYKFRLVLPQDLLDRDRLNVYHIEVQLPDGDVRRERLSHKNYLGLMAANDIKQRTRMIQLYYEAEKRYYVVCGTTNRSEALQGFFVKFGDGGVDIEPLADLYKVQVYQLGAYLGVPEEIISRTPSPDTYSFEVSDEDFYFCMPYSILDYMLYGVEKNIPKSQVAEMLQLSGEQVERAWKDLSRKRELTEHLRQPPPAPGFEW